MNPAVWIIAAALLAIGELLSLDLVLLMLAGAALVAGGTAGLTGALAPQLAAFAATALLLLLVVRPVARRHLEVASLLPSSVEQLPGRAALVIEQVSEHTGQVRVDGELWRARPYAGGPPLPPGTSVVVAAVDGATLHVYQKELK